MHNQVIDAVSTLPCLRNCMFCNGQGDRSLKEGMVDEWKCEISITLNHHLVPQTFPPHCTGDKPMVLPTPGNLSGRFSETATAAMNSIKTRPSCKSCRPSFFLRSSASVCLVGLEREPTAANVLPIPTNQL